MLSAVDSVEAERAKLRGALLEHGLKFGEGFSREGNRYQWLLDTREVLLRPGWLEVAARLLWRKLKPYRPEVVGGMTLAANPLTIALMAEAARDGHPVQGAIIRREPKADGLRKQVEGPPIPRGARMVLLDDLVNMGDTQKQALKAVAPFEPQVVACGVLVDYQRAGASWLREQQIPLEALFTLSDLGVAIQPPSRPGAAELAWGMGPLNTARYDAPKSAAVVHGDSLYVGSDAGFIFCATLEGEERWRYGVRDQQRGVHATPLVQGGKVIAGAYDGFLYALDAASGELAWEKRPGQWIGSSAAGDPEHDRLFVGVEFGENGGKLIAVRASTGDAMWEAPAQGYIHSSPFLDAARGQVLVGCNDYSLYAFDAQTGARRWSSLTGGEIKSNPTVSPEGLAFCTSFDGWLYALDAATGRPLWKRRLGHSLYFTPLCARDLVIAGSYSSRVVALERATGHVRWVATTGDRVVGGGALCGDQEEMVAITSCDGCLYLFDTATGATLFQDRPGAPSFMGTPTWTGQLLLVPSMSGPLYAYRLGARLSGPPAGP
jgi:outer membrane protein assembly factor BamB/orotate phosphoribosyltransferase